MEEIPLAIGISILLAAIFSGMEIAYMKADRASAEDDSKKGRLPARALAFFIHNPTYFYTASLVGLKIAIVLFAVYSGKAIENFLINTGWISSQQVFLIFFVQAITITFTLLILGEILVRVLFRPGFRTLLSIFSFPFVLFYWLLSPFLILLAFLARLVFRRNLFYQEQELSRQDLADYVEESYVSEEQDTAELDKKIFKNAIEFYSVRVRDCMIPRTEIAAVDITDDLEDAKRIFIETGHSKLLVYRETIDNFIGYIHLVDLFRNPMALDQMIMPIVIAPETMPVADLMHKLLEKHRSIAVVVDEFGGTSGIITMEDILEEIVGDIEDEHDVDALTELKISDTEYIFSARQEIEYLNDTYHLDLPEGDYDTLGGLIFYVHQNIPNPGDVIIEHPFEFTILGMDQTRITEVRLRIIKEEEEEEKG